MGHAVDFDDFSSGKLEPICDHVIVNDIETAGERTINGVIIPGEDANVRGIRPRWARVHAVGPEQDDVKAGQWILVEHARWTRGVRLDDGFTYRKVDPKAILLVSDDQPTL